MKNGAAPGTALAPAPTLADVLQRIDQLETRLAAVVREQARQRLRALRAVDRALFIVVGERTGVTWFTAAAICGRALVDPGLEAALLAADIDVGQAEAAGQLGVLLRRCSNREVVEGLCLTRGTRVADGRQWCLQAM